MYRMYGATKFYDMATIKLTFRASLSKDKEGTLYYQVIHKQVARQICTGSLLSNKS